MSKECYKRLGDYIQLVDVRTKALEVDNLLGLRIGKKFIPSIICDAIINKFQGINKLKELWSLILSKMG